MGEDVKTYHVLVPYSCLVSVLFRTDTKISTADQAIDGAMSILDKFEPIFEFQNVSKDDREYRPTVHVGKYSKQATVAGDVRPFTNMISWQEINTAACAPADEGPQLELDLSPTPPDVMILHLDAGSDKNGNPRRCFVVYGSGGRIIEAIDERFSGRRICEERYPGSTFLGTFKTLVGEYRSILKEFQSKP